MKTAFFALLVSTFLVSSLSMAKWIDPEKEEMKNRTMRAWQGVDFTFSGFSSSAGTSSITYHKALNDFWAWDGGVGVDTMGWFLTGGGRYFIYNWPKTTCFFFFACHGQVTGGLNLNYSSGGRKTYENAGVDSKYDQGNSISAWPTVGFRSIYRDFFSLALDVGYRFMVQKPTISRGYGPVLQTAVDDMEKNNKDGFGASVSVGVVF